MHLGRYCTSAAYIMNNRRELYVLHPVHRNILETAQRVCLVHGGGGLSGVVTTSTRLHSWFRIHLQRDEVELEMNSEPRV